MIFIRSSNCWRRDLNSLISLIRASSTTISLRREVVARALMLNRSVEILATKKHQCAGNQKDAAKNHQELLLALLAQLFAPG